MATAAITGVAGFVGSNLARRLLRDGWVVRGLDNLCHGYRDNLERLEDTRRFTFVHGDVRDSRALRELMRGADTVVHLAAYKIPRYGNALATLQVNTHGMRAVLKVAEQSHIKVVFASTSDVYGKNPNLPFSESSDLYLGAPHVKRWSYAMSKLFDEYLCLAKAREGALRVAVLRYFGGYGPRQNPSWMGGPQAVFISQILNGEPLTIHGDGQQTRTFTYVDDLVAGTVRAMECEKANGEILNLGAGHPISIAGLAEMIWRMMRADEEVKISYTPYSTFGRYEDVRHRVPNTAKAKALLGFEARTTLEIGLPPTIEWQRKTLQSRRQPCSVG
jgi:UDP-glucose 4-epimerase